MDSRHPLQSGMISSGKLSHGWAAQELHRAEPEQDKGEPSSTHGLNCLETSLVETQPSKVLQDDVEAFLEH